MTFLRMKQPYLILGDFELRKVVNSPQSWGAGGTKNVSSQTRRGLEEKNSSVETLISPLFF